MKGKIFTNQIKDIILHTYVSTEESFQVTTHILETPEALIIIDVQFLIPFAEEVKKYIISLSKKVECVLISHSHPDHWLGIEVFKEYKISALPKVSEEISSFGDSIIEQVSRVHPGNISTKAIIPKPDLLVGKNKIAGITMEIKEYCDAEGSIHMLLYLPDYEILIAQDLVYNKVHLFLGNNHLKNWIKIIKELKQYDNCNLILAGHGEPSTQEVYDEMLDYINKAKSILISNGNKDDLKKFLCFLFPDFKCEHLIDISNDYLFYGEHIL